VAKESFTRRARPVHLAPLPHAFSQEGEDLILGRVFEGKSDGFYVDVGRITQHFIRILTIFIFAVGAESLTPCPEA
jgi:hypothetical protein